FLPALYLDLQPFFGTALGVIGTIGFFGHNALQAYLLSGIEKLDAARRKDLALADTVIICRQNVLQHGLAPNQRTDHQAFAFIPKDIKNVIDQVAISLAAPVLEGPEIRQALVVKYDDLSVDYRIDLPIFQQVHDWIVLIKWDIIA